MANANTTPSAHTPGPWHVPHDPHADIDVVEDTHGERVAFPYGTNARLIAAAPDLLDALELLLQQTVDMDLAYGIELTEGEQEARSSAIKAIAKSQGR